MVILRCWTGLYLNWFNSYDTKRKYIFLDLAIYEMINGRFPTISSQFCYLLNYLSLNWGSDGHFEVLNRCEPQLLQKLWHKMQIRRLLIDKRICITCLKSLWSDLIGNSLIKSLSNLFLSVSITDLCICSDWHSNCFNVLDLITR